MFRDDRYKTTVFHNVSSCNVIEVIFSQASVILSTGGVPAPAGGGLFLGGVCSWGGVPGGDTPGTATAAGGTHPTGMHSCLNR